MEIKIHKILVCYTNQCCNDNQRKCMVYEWEFQPFIELESPSSKDALYQDCLKLAQWFWRKDFLISSMYFCYFVFISLGKGQCLLLNKLELSSTKDALTQVWFNLKIIKFRQCTFTILYLSPFGKGGGGSFEQTWILFTQGCFVPSLVEIGSLVLEKIF